MSMIVHQRAAVKEPNLIGCIRAAWEAWCVRFWAQCFVFSCNSGVAPLSAKTLTILLGVWGTEVYHVVHGPDRQRPVSIHVVTIYPASYYLQSMQCREFLGLEHHWYNSSCHAARNYHDRLGKNKFLIGSLTWDKFFFLFAQQSLPVTGPSTNFLQTFRKCRIFNFSFHFCSGRSKLTVLYLFFGKL